MIRTRVLLCIVAALSFANAAPASPGAYDEDDYTLRSAWVVSAERRDDALWYWRPTVNGTVFAGLARDLALDESQRAIARELHEAYLDDHVTLWTELAERLHDTGVEFYLKAREDDDDDELSAAERAATGEIRQEFAERADALVDIFLDDLALMTTDDDQRWVRARTSMEFRTRLSRYGGVTHDGYFLPDIVERLDLTESQRTRIAPLLDDYRRELEIALAARRSAFSALVSPTARYVEATRSWPRQARGAAEDERQRLSDARNETRATLIKRVMDAMPACDRVAQLNRTHRDIISRELDDDNARLLGAMFEPEKVASYVPDEADDSDVRDLIYSLLQEGPPRVDDGMRVGSEWRTDRIALLPDPITPCQRVLIEDLLADFENDIDELQRERPRTLDDAIAQARPNINLRTPGAGIRLRFRTSSVEVDSEAYNRDIRRQTRAFVILEQEYLHRLRDLLTVRQRAAIIE